MPGGMTPVPTENSVGKSTMPQELANLRAELVRMHGKADLPSDVQVLKRRNELVIRLSDNLLFAPGDDQLKDPSRASVKALGTALAARNVDVRVEGHTDDRPIHTARFRSNWDLSTARAASVVAVLAEAGMPAPRLSAAGYGEFHPIASNDTEVGRKLNRRVDLVVSAAAPPAEEIADSDIEGLDGGAAGAASGKDAKKDEEKKDEEKKDEAHGKDAKKDEEKKGEAHGGGHDDHGGGHDAHGGGHDTHGGH